MHYDGSRKPISIGRGTQEGFRKLLQVAAKEGCEYFCFNIKVTICNKCGYIDKHTLQKCSKCGSTDIDYGTRVIGYLTRISSWSKERRAEHERRMYMDCKSIENNCKDDDKNKKDNCEDDDKNKK